MSLNKETVLKDNGKEKNWKLGLELPLLCSSRKSNNGIIDGNVEDRKCTK